MGTFTAGDVKKSFNVNGLYIYFLLITFVQHWFATPLHMQKRQFIQLQYVGRHFKPNIDSYKWHLEHSWQLHFEELTLMLDFSNWLSLLRSLPWKLFWDSFFLSIVSEIFLSAPPGFSLTKVTIRQVSRGRGWSRQDEQHWVLAHKSCDTSCQDGPFINLMRKWSLGLLQ